MLISDFVCSTNSNTIILLTVIVSNLISLKKHLFVTKFSTNICTAKNAYTFYVTFFFVVPFLITEICIHVQRVTFLRAPVSKCEIVSREICHNLGWSKSSAGTPDIHEEFVRNDGLEMGLLH